MIKVYKYIAPNSPVVLVKAYAELEGVPMPVLCHQIRDIPSRLKWYACRTKRSCRNSSLSPAFFHFRVLVDFLSFFSLSDQSFKSSWCIFIFFCKKGNVFTEARKAKKCCCLCILLFFSSCSCSSQSSLVFFFVLVFQESHSLWLDTTDERRKMPFSFRLLVPVQFIGREAWCVSVSFLLSSSFSLSAWKISPRKCLLFLLHEGVSSNCSPGGKME